MAKKASGSNEKKAADKKAAGKGNAKTEESDNKKVCPVQRHHAIIQKTASN